MFRRQDAATILVFGCVGRMLVAENPSHENVTLKEKMNPEIRLKLQKYDELGSYEFPRDFNYFELEVMAKKVDAAIRETGLKTTFEGAVYNQDASFSIAIILDDYKVVSNNVFHLPTIRFSNFGFLTSLTGKEMIPIEKQGAIVKILLESGFDYIPDNELDSPYDGVMEDKKTFSTWWIRYFDWL